MKTPISQLLNPVVRDMPPSGIRRFFDIVSTMKDAISLGVGEPDFVTPWTMREAGVESIIAGKTSYTSNWGTIELRRLIARYMKERFALDYDPATQLFVTVGASEGVDLVMRTILRPGDEVLIPEPSYVSYSPCVTMAGGVAVPIVTTAEHEFKLTAQALRETITSKTKALLLSYPNNPTGAIMERPHLEAIAAVLRDTDILVVSDEVYAELTYDARHVSVASLPGMMERTIVLNGFSKAFAMTGWRVGFVAGHAELVGAMLKIHQYTALCASIMGQAAAQAGLGSELSNGFSEVSRMVRAYNRRRRMVVDSFNAMGLECFEPKGAFYAFPSIAKTGMTSAQFCEELLRSEKVAVVPGTAFGESGEGFIRASYAASNEKLSEALMRIERFVKHNT